jgi:hypothetical protein
MAITSASLKSKIETQLTAQGFEINGEHAMVSKMAQAIAIAVVDEITSNAEVVISGGSSSGNYAVT